MGTSTQTAVQAETWLPCERCHKRISPLFSLYEVGGQDYLHVCVECHEKLTEWIGSASKWEAAEDSDGIVIWKRKDEIELTEAEADDLERLRKHGMAKPTVPITKFPRP